MTTAQQHSLDKSKINILLLEGVHASALDVLHEAGYTSIQTAPKALQGDELKAAIADVHFVGIRSQTQLTAQVLEHATKLVAVGCFCIGTNQVDLETAARLAIPVFNAPFSNTRSVAELVMGEVVMLLRGIPD
ncbi:MAG: phosphoglycerate dehydrogenase, partial [Burkholderiaceae bacterium]|nr:phosphoglycerate dehydrogenase [Burkholderiaceae bacterium]